MKNEIPVVSKETEKDNASFPEETNTRVLEMALIAYTQSSVSGGEGVEDEDQESLIGDKIQSHFSTIFKDSDILKDEDLYY